MSLITHHSPAPSANFEPRYDLHPEQTEHITTEFLRRETAGMRGRYVCIEVADGEEMSNVARGVEREVFEDTFENDASVMEEIYGSYDQEGISTFFVGFDRRKAKAISVVRAMGWSARAGIMTVNEAQKPDWINVSMADMEAAHGLDEETLRHTWDVGTLAVLREYRGKLSGLQASLLPYRGFYLASTERGIKKMTVIMDPRARRSLERLGIPLENICGSDPVDYHGSKNSTFVIGDIAESMPAIEAQARQLRKDARLTVNDVLHPNKDDILKRRLYARAAGGLASGRGLDSRISLLNR